MSFKRGSQPTEPIATKATLGSAPTADPHNPLMRPGGTPGTPVEKVKMAKHRGKEKKEGKAAQSDANGGHRILGGDLCHRVVDG